MDEEVTPIYYNYNTNAFTDEFGQVRYDISDIMPFGQIMLYKRIGGAYYCKANSEGEVFCVNFPMSIDSNRKIIYYPIDNTFNDEDDEIIFNIFSILTPNDLLLFKQNKQSICIPGPQGGMIDLIYYKGLDYDE